MHPAPVDLKVVKLWLKGRGREDVGIDGKCCLWYRLACHGGLVKEQIGADVALDVVDHAGAPLSGWL